MLASVASVHPIDAPLIHGAPPGTPNCTLGPLSASQAGLLSPHDADYQDFLIETGSYNVGNFHSDLAGSLGIPAGLYLTESAAAARSDGPTREQLHPGHRPATYEELAACLNLDKLRASDPTYREFESDPQVGPEKAEAAVHHQLKRLAEYGAVAIVKLPSWARALGAKMVWKYKDPDAAHPGGRATARFTPKGFGEREGEHYEQWELPSPVASKLCQRACDISAVKRGACLEVCDVSGAFLYGHLAECKVIYVRGFPGLDLGDGNVLLLLRSVYGIREAPQIWYRLLDSFMRSQDYLPSDVDPCVYVHSTSPDLRVVVFHVDDGKLLFDEQEELDKFKESLAAEWSITDHGPISLCVGIEYTRLDDGSLELRISRFINKAAARFGLAECNPRNVPLTKREWDDAESKDHAPLEGADLETYFALTGCIQYAATTGVRPDVAVSAHLLGSARARATSGHLTAAYGVMRYLSGSADRALVLRRGDPNDTTLTWFSDSNHAADRLTCRSVTGGAGFVGECPLSYLCRGQKSVQISSTGSETVAMSANAREILLSRRVLEVFGLAQKEPTVMRADNQAAIALSENSTMLTDLSKHLAVRDRFIRETVRDGFIKLVWVSTNHNLADLFTKPLPFPAFAPMLAVVTGWASHLGL